MSGSNGSFWTRQNLIAKLPAGKFNGTLKLVLYVLSNFIGNNPDCHPKVETLASAAGIRPETFRRKIKHLAKTGVVSVEYGGGRNNSNLYQICLDRLAELAEKGDTQSGFTEETGTHSPGLSQIKGDSESLNTDSESLNTDSQSLNTDSRSRGTNRTTKNNQEQRALPPELDTDEFRNAWTDWQTHRRQKGSKLTPIAIERQLTKLSKLGPSKAVAAIEHSIENGWTGIFEPKQPKAGSGSSSTDQLFDRLTKFVERLDSYQPMTPAVEQEFGSDVARILTGELKPATLADKSHPRDREQQRRVFAERMRKVAA